MLKRYSYPLSLVLTTVFLFGLFEAVALGGGASPPVSVEPEKAPPVRTKAEEAPVAGEAPKSYPPSIADAFIGEELDYSIGFWFFKSVAVGTLSFKRGPDGGYEATLEAHARGVADKLLKRRRDKYTSYMYLSEDGRMFLTSRFERVITTSEKKKVKNKYVDYGKRLLTIVKWKDEGEKESEVIDFPEGIDGIVPVDPLAAFYNFRAGAYGELAPGGEYQIPALPKKDEGVPEIYFRIVTDAEFADRKTKAGTMFLADALIGKDLFGSDKGEMELCFDADFVPIYAVAKGVDYLGNVRGTLVTPDSPAVQAASTAEEPEDGALDFD